MPPNILIFSSLLLPASQTFVKSQAERLTHYTPYYVGSRQVAGLDLPADRVYVVDQGGRTGQLQELIFKLTGQAPNLDAALKPLRPVLIHAQFGLSGALALPLAERFQIPLLVHFRGADICVKESVSKFSSLNHWLYFRRRRLLQKRAHLFLAVSQFIRQKLLEQQFPEEKIHVHYNGVDLDYFKPTANHPPREPILLFIGRLIAKKGTADFIKAAAKVQGEHPEVKAIIIGDGELRSQLEYQASKHLSNYQFLGTQPATVIRDWMQQAQVMVVPSITTPQGDAEGLPNVVLEAQAMGLPVVSTRHAGIPEAIKHGKTGFLVAEGDWCGLAAYSSRLLGNSDLWQTFSQQGQHHMQQKFDRAAQSKKLENLYLSTLQKG
ncbi:MAG: glycosyltransferase [Cyanobacteria bacterium J06635_1]